MGEASIDPSPGAVEPRWLLCVASMPADDPASRMRVLRTLESLGTTVLREGVYLLPETEANRRSLETLAEYIGKSHGAAHVLSVSATSPAQHEAFVLDQVVQEREGLLERARFRVGERRRLHSQFSNCNSSSLGRL